jgi:CO/xanthine dehydrogenase Mo-binding subunit
VPRLDADTKARGTAEYTADILLPGMLHAKVLRSPHAHARLVTIDASRASALEGVHAVATRDDLIGLDPFHGFIRDQPVLAIDRVRYVGDVVAAVAAVDEETALRALELIEVTYDPLPAVATIEQALADGAPELFETAPPATLPPHGTGASARFRPRPNVSYELSYESGPTAAWSDCEHVFEDSFVFSRMNHFHLEPFVSLARVEGEQIEVWSSTQAPFRLRRELARIFAQPENRIRVHVTHVGGAFGAKSGCRTEPIAILLARLAKRPVRFCLTVEEGFLTLSQHEAVMRLRTGVTSDGTLVARECELLLNAGAYTDASPPVVDKAGYRVIGPYRWRHVRSTSACVITNTTPAGAFRGFGGAQAAWASESQVDMIARRLGIDPYDLRSRNLKGLGERYAPGDTALDSDLLRGLDVVAKRIGYRRRRRRPSRGMGLAVGVNDAGGVNKPASARVKVTTSGDVFLQCGTVEMGQGAHTALRQMAAEILSVPLERVAFTPIDTDSTPFDQGTFASSSTVVMGQAVADACERVKIAVLELAAGQLGTTPDELALRDWTVHRGDEVHPLEAMIVRHYGGGGFEIAAEGFSKASRSNDAPFGAACPCWEVSWAAAEVEVDRETGQVQVLQLIVSGDAGRAIHHQACRGQLEGAAMMGLGQALFEEMRYDGPTLINGEALDYRVPMAGDLPDRFVSITQEQGHGPGPFGAKGMGEAGILPVAAAIANAVDDAVGARVTVLPLTPERVLAAIDAARPPQSGRSEPR